MVKFVDVHESLELLLQDALASEQLAVDAILLWDVDKNSDQRRLLFGDVDDNKRRVTSDMLGVISFIRGFGCYILYSCFECFIFSIFLCFSILRKLYLDYALSKFGT